MPKGVIKKLVADRGFGFISTESGSDIFFHHSAVADEGFDNLQEGQSVEYEVDSGDGGGGRRGNKGPRATAVTPL
ncbi:MAG: cold shock domain-containing protein [Pirellulales bacterium]|nr:cold shock domain-containing protein [Pirellulales bacterium]